MGKRIDEIPQETLDALIQYRWPGNVRELQNFIERAVILSPAVHFACPNLRIGGASMSAPPNVPMTGREEVERDHILRA
jgi:formate hydrogenlyase transcriptional activator